MKKIISLCLSIVLVLGIFLGIPFTDSLFEITAEAVSVSDLTFQLNDDGESYSVTDCNESASGVLKIPVIYNGKPVTSIADSAFDKCKNIESVTISDSITSIGDYAFWYCERMTSIIIPDSVTSIGELAFFNTSYYNNRDNWENGVLYIDNHLIAANTYINDEYIWGFFGNIEGAYTIKEGIKTISSSAFRNCTELTDITIPNTVTGIRERAFYECTSLVTINVSSGNQYYTSVDGVLFNKDKTELIQYPAAKTDISYTVPDSVTSIGDFVFYWCTNLISITIPDSVTSIGDGVFEGCSNLHTVTMPDRVASIGDSAFEGCTSLTSITIPRGVTSIGVDAFCGCCSLTSITIPDGVTNIGAYAFKLCTNLISITIPDSVNTINFNAFNNTAYYNDSSNWENGVLYIGNHLIEADRSISGSYEIKAGTKSIADSAVDWCISLTSIKIPDSVTNIGEFAFYFCDNLRTVTIGNNVTNISDSAFGYCSRLTSITIPDSVMSIGDSAFYHCERLKSVTIGSGVTSIDENAFCWCGSLTDVYYPGSPLQWLEIEISNGGNDCLTDANIHFGKAIKPEKPELKTVSNSTSGVKVSWERVLGADKYRVYRKTHSSGWTCLNSEVISTSYTDTTAKSGTIYYYTVKAENNAGISGHNTTGLAIKYLATPVLKIANASSGVKVSWNKISGASKYYVYRKASGDKDWTRLTTSATGASYTDTKAKSGMTYYYTVRAVSGKVASSFKSSSALIYLAMPKISSLSNANSGITVKWNKIPGASGYYVYRKTSSGSWSRIYTAKNGSTVSYTDKAAKAGTTYYYTVRAYNGSVKSTYTSSSAVRRLATPTIKSVSSAKRGITLNWDKVTGASGYYVYRKTESGGWQKIAIIKKGSIVSYLDKTAKKGVVYTYTVRAYYGNSVSYYNTKGLNIKDKY